MTPQASLLFELLTAPPDGGLVNCHWNADQWASLSSRCSLDNTVGGAWAPSSALFFHPVVLSLHTYTHTTLSVFRRISSCCRGIWLQSLRAALRSARSFFPLPLRASVFIPCRKRLCRWRRAVFSFACVSLGLSTKKLLLSFKATFIFA